MTDDDALVVGQGEAAVVVVVVESDVAAVGGDLSAVGVAAVEEDEDDENDDEDVVMMAAIDVEEEVVRESQALEVEKEVTSVDLSAAVEVGMTVDLGFDVRVVDGPVFVAGLGLACFERWDHCYVSLRAKDRGFGGLVAGTLDYGGSEELELVVRGFGAQNLGFGDVVTDGLGFGKGAVEIVGRFGGFVEVDPGFVDEAVVDDVADGEAAVAVETGIPSRILNNPVRPARQHMEKWRRCPVSFSVKSVSAPLIKGTQYAG